MICAKWYLVYISFETQKIQDYFVGTNEEINREAHKSKCQCLSASLKKILSGI